MPRFDEYAEIVVNGRAFRDWKAVEITHRFQDWAVYCTLATAEPGDTRRGWPALRLKIGDRGQVRLAGEMVVDGVIFCRQTAYDAHQHGVSVIVGTKLANLVAASVEAKPGQYKDYSYSAIARSVLRPFGVEFRMEAKGGGADKKFPRVNVQVGETAFAFLDRLARFRNLFLTGAPDGALMATRGPRGAVSAPLQEGRNIKSAQLVMKDSTWPSKVEVKGQGPGSDKAWGDEVRGISATARNPNVRDHRPIVLVAEMPGDKKDMQMRADHELAVNSADVIQGSIVVKGWHHDDGSLWIRHVGKTVRVHSPMLFPVTDALTLAIEQVTHRQNDKTGSETEIVLTHPMRLGGGGMIEGPTAGLPAIGGGSEAARPDGDD